MNLPFLNKKEPDKNFFLSLLVKPYSVTAILFEEVNNKLVVLSTNEAQVDSDIDQMSQEDLLQAADRTISSVEPSLPNDITVEKTIFSLPYSWVEENKIKDSDLSKLKTVCKALGLTPIGYLTSIEAIVHFIDKKEGAPVSAVFLEITKTSIFAYVVRAGKVIEALSATITGGVIDTAEAILAKVRSIDTLPAKIILLDLENSSSVQQEFLSHKWPQSIPFLHVPQVVVLEKGFENEAIVNGVATQMELEVSKDIQQAEEAPSFEAAIPVTSAEDFGFVKDEDVAKKAESPEVESNVSETDFAADKVPDIGEQALTGAKPEEIDVNYFKEHEGEITEEAFPGEKKKMALPLNFDGIFRSIKKIKLPASFPKLPVGGGSKNKLIVIIIAAVAILIAFLYLYYNVILQAQVNVFEDSKAIDKTASITFAKEASGEDQIQLSIVEAEIKGDENKNATGKKETGDKAKGSVTIYNKTESSKNFEKGTTVVGPNSLEFVLTDEVKIASTSSFSTNLSSASVKVEAAKFGKEYNIPSNSNFTVKGFSTSDFIAKNSDATSGGSSKTTTVVSAKDLSELSSLLTQKLQGDAISKAKSEAGGNDDILPVALASEVKDRKYSKKEGDEAATVGLSATIVYSIGKYDKTSLDNMVKNLSKNEVPGTYVMQKGDSVIDVTDVKPDKDGESASATLKVKAVYSPQIDSAALAKTLKGKSVSGATEEIKKISGVSDVNVQWSRKIPLLPAFLPFNSNNIKIEIKN